MDHPLVPYNNVTEDIFSWRDELKDRIQKSTMAYCKKRTWKAQEAKRDVRAVLEREASLLARP